MPVRMISMSHSPLMLVPELRPKDRPAERGFYSALSTHAAALKKWKPELVILFAPDHFNGFFNDLMPPFCIGTAAESTRDWKIPKKKLKIDAALAERCVVEIRDGVGLRERQADPDRCLSLRPHADEHLVAGRRQGSHGAPPDQLAGLVAVAPALPQSQSLHPDVLRFPWPKVACSPSSGNS